MKPSVLTILNQYASGERTPIDVVSEALERRASAHALTNCTALPLDDRARAMASESLARWRGGRARPLEGIPFSLKDMFHLKGTPTSAGSLCGDPLPVTSTAHAIQKLLDAGAIPIAKDTTTEWAIGGAVSRRFGVTRNPLSPDRWTGGSSCGSAAMVSAGVVPFAVGTDTGGSIRLPSAFCGIIGFKPGNARISREGVVALSPSLDTVGLLCSHAQDLQRIFPVMATETDAHDTATALPAIPQKGLDGLRIGIPKKYFLDGVDDAVARAFHAFLDALVAQGAILVDIVLPLAPQAQEIGYQLLYTEAWAIHQTQQHRFHLYEEVARTRITRGSTSSQVDLLDMLNFRDALKREFKACFARVDLIATPGCPGTAARLDTMTIAINGQDVPLLQAQSRATIMCNLAALPAIMLPIGQGSDGLPVSAQLVAPQGQEMRGIATAIAYQATRRQHIVQ